MSTKKYSLTDEHRAQLKPWADRWIANALRTEPQTDADRDAMRVAMRGMYSAAKLAPPANEVFAPGPISAAIAASIAAGVWYLREHPEVLGHVSEAELRASSARAVRIAVRLVRASLRGEPLPRVALGSMSPRVTAATYDATVSLTEATTDAATRVAAYNATEAETDAATNATTEATTHDATNAATAATAAATTTATRAATYDATYAATDAATDAATNVETDAATRDATYNTTYTATYAATYAATTAEARDATNTVIRDATFATTNNATYAATQAATYSATRVATSAPIEPVTKFLLGCLQYQWRMRNAGNQWSGWVAFLSFFDRVVGLDLPQYEAFRHYETTTIHAGPRYMHAKFWIASDFPTTIGRDDQHRPHCADGPQQAWRDGFALYYWHGVRVPAQVIEAPETLTAEQIDRETNSEVRRVMITRYGLARYAASGETLHEDNDQFGRPRRLVRRRMEDGVPDLVMLLVKNSSPEPDGTHKDYGLRCHPELRPMFSNGQFGEPQSLTCQNAVASLHGKRGAEYRPEVET